MRWIGRLVDVLTSAAVFVIAIPWLIGSFLFFVLCGVLGGFLVFSMLRGLVAGTEMLSDAPSTFMGALGFVLCLIPAIGGGLLAWSNYTGVSLGALRTGKSHGSARLSSRQERAALQRGEGLLIGRDAGNDRLLRYDGPAHLLTLAPTRAGKGVGTIIPNLLTAKRSVLVIDPKGENARITVRARSGLGPVHVFDPFAVTGLPTAACNPLDRLQRGSPDLGEDAAALAEALVMDPPGQVSEAHWNEEAKALLAGLILFAACHEEPGRRTLGSVREYLTLPPERLRALLELMQESEAAHGLIARAANRFLGKADREAASVLSNAQRHTHFLDSPRIAVALSRTDLDFADLRHGIVSVFLVLPPNRLDTHSRWLRLLVAQALQDIARDAERPQERLSGAESPTEAPDGGEGPGTPGDALRATLKPATGPVLFLLDEFAALGRLEPVERAMGLMAGYGIQLWPILQGETAFWKRLAIAFRWRTSQLKAIYGQRAGTFIANAGVQQVFGVNDFETAEWLSRMIGKETTSYQSYSRRQGLDEATTTTTNLTGRDLLTPDEIMQLPAHLQLLRLQGQPVTLARKLRYYADPEFTTFFDPDKA